ncbi:hypothetical protein BGZ57DRAFT_908880 [Hyaloscypha finlandica]|nr:hypothetical protein BGZ57DRAFT_908880 [Hyaloscypha finlandica]
MMEEVGRRSALRSSLKTTFACCLSLCLVFLFPSNSQERFKFEGVFNLKYGEQTHCSLIQDSVLSRLHNLPLYLRRERCLSISLKPGCHPLL